MHLRKQLVYAIAAWHVMFGCVRGNEPSTAGVGSQLPAITRLSAAEGRQVICGGPEDVFFSQLRRREAAAMTGVARDDESLEETRLFAREFFAAAVLEFSAAESAALRAHVAGLVALCGDKYPLLVRRPWKFIKTRGDLCGGFSFTRGDCIVLSERTLSRLVAEAEHGPETAKSAHTLLLHEQMHVLQRERPEMFLALYEQVFGFRKARVRVADWIDERQVTNPDGLDEDWVLLVEGEPRAPLEAYWLGTLLLTENPVPIMGRDFLTVAVPLRAAGDGDGYEMQFDDAGAPRYSRLDELPRLTTRFPVRSGYDHPNEIAAYLLPALALGKTNADSVSPGSVEVLSKSRDWFEQALGAK